MSREGDLCCFVESDDLQLGLGCLGSVKLFSASGWWICRTIWVRIIPVCDGDKTTSVKIDDVLYGRAARIPSITDENAVCTVNMHGRRALEFI